MPDTSIPVTKSSAPTLQAPRRSGVDFWRSFHDEVDHLFDRFSGGLRPPSFGRLFEPTVRETAFAFAVPAVDATEDDQAFRITAELPGMTEKDIAVKLSDGMITVSGEKRVEKEHKDKDYHLSERRYGSFQRAFALPDSVDAEKIDATFAQGVLTLTLPKKPEAVKQQKKIEVKAS